MSRLSEKLRLFQITKSTRFLSHKLYRFSLATLRACTSLAKLFLSKTLTPLFLPMDSDDISLFSSSDSFLISSSTRTLLDEPEKLYLVPHRWWSEGNCGGEGGVLYDVDVEDCNGDEIVLNLRKEEGFECREEGVSDRVYALVSEPLWFRALKWHNDSKLAEIDVRSSSLAEDNILDIFSLQIGLSVSWESNCLVVKIRYKDNYFSSYRKASDIFGFQSQPFHFWDYSGQTTQLFLKNGINLPNGSSGPSGDEISLELQVHGLSDSGKGGDHQADGKIERNWVGTSFGTSSVKMNGGSELVGSYAKHGNYSRFIGSYKGIGLLGLTGLLNLGNTCFMNSAIQCLAHTPKLVDYFLGDYKKEINPENPLGMNGEIALAFGDLSRKLWYPGSAPVSPRLFKLKVATFAPQFSGSNQHDSQEFLAFMLDGLHEDLNRVKSKPYIEAKDADDRPDKEVAEEYWQNHLARNDSIIVDLFQGQYRSTLVCPVCKKKSVTFDPFMYLSLPLPSTTMRTMTVTVLSTDGTALPSPVTVTVPKCGRLKDLIDALTSACSLRDDETLLVAEIYRNKIFRLLEEPSDSLALIRDADKLAAYRLPKDSQPSPLVVFVHERVEKPYEFERVTSKHKLFGIPLVTRLSNFSNESDLQKQFLKLLNPFLMPDDEILNDYDDAVVTANEDSAVVTANEDSAMEDIVSPKYSDGTTGTESEIEDDSPPSTDFQFYLKDDCKSREIRMNEPLPRGDDKLDVCVFWSDKMIEKYDTCLLGALPEVLKPQLYTRRPQESVSLYKCLEAFLKEEPLGPEDMWHCPSCNKPRQASKKLDLWRLPEILVVHLKRFSYGRHFKNKLETHVDFPIDDLDLSNFIAHEDSKVSDRYVLFAISNHFGGMGGGHYTAFADVGDGKWFEFDDDRVYIESADRIKTPAAYVLFYRRIS